MTDIDIDFPHRDAALAVLKHISAIRMDDGMPTKHISGVYVQDIPVDPFTNGDAALDTQEAEDLGYFKIDFLNNSIYQAVHDDAHLCRLVAQEPLWELLEDESIVGMLAHIRGHFALVQHIKPTSIEDLAVILALIRPGKRHLTWQTRGTIDREIWTTPADGSYHYKKAHAMGFALSIVVQLNLLVEANSPAGDIVREPHI